MSHNTPRHIDRETPAPGHSVSVLRRREDGRRSRGQSLVEFALILPVLILVLALAADFGRAFTAYIAIGSAAREGAAYGMWEPGHAIDTAGIEAAALADAPTIWGTAPTVDSWVDADAQNYVRVNVTVDYTFTTFLSIPPIPATIDMDRTVSMRVLN